MSNCPITQDSMTEPVFCIGDGHTYEKYAIEKWIQEHGTSPVDPSKRLSLSMLYSNYSQRVESGGNPVSTTVGFDTAVIVESNKVTVKSYPEIQVKTLQTEKLERREPVSLCCVIDISGSMSSGTTCPSKSGVVEDYGFNILDLVKYAVEVVIESMNDEDRLSIVAFDDKIDVIQNSKNMTSNNKREARKLVKSLETRGTTNIHDATTTALDILYSDRDSDGKTKSVILFTDGLPNVHPVKGELKGLIEYYENRTKKEQPIIPVSYFGFSNNVDSELMYNLSVVSQGMFYYIPDINFVGTIFNNAMANIYTTFGTDASFDGNKIGFLRHSTSLCFDSSTNSSNSSNLKYFEGETLKHEHEPFSENSFECNQTSHRVEAVKCIKKCIKLCFSHRNVQVDEHIDNLILEIERDIASPNGFDSSNIETKEYLEDLVKDLDRQIREACTSKYFPTWGRHFLHSILRAHEVGYCNNFKDPGVQHYGNDSMFQNLLQEMNTIFVSIERPEPSRHEAPQFQAFSAGLTPMTTLINPDTICVDRFCEVNVYNIDRDSWTPISAQLVQKGDLVETVQGMSEVECVVKTNKTHVEFVSFPTGLLITELHPVLYEGRFVHPKTLLESGSNGIVREVSGSTTIFSFVLKNRQPMIINSIPVVTLGHGVSEDAVLSHPFYGTSKVIDCLRSMRGWERGLVEFQEDCVVRENNEERTVVGLKNEIY